MVLRGVEVQDGLEEGRGVLDVFLAAENIFNQEVGQWGNELVWHGVVSLPYLWIGEAKTL
jgi:hypothetical protein